MRTGAAAAGHGPALPVTPLRSTGTVNAIYRLGDHLYARLPHVARWARNLETESHWLPRLAPGLSLRIPEPVAMGQPGDRYLWSWAIYRAAVMLIPYYRETNPGMAALGRGTVGQVVADLRARGGGAAGPGPSARSRW
jgi:hypothetical protein